MPTRSTKVSFTKVTWYSQIAAIIIFVGVYYLGFYVGYQYEMAKASPVFSVMRSISNRNSSLGSFPGSAASAASSEKLLNNVTFMCPASSPSSAPYIAAQFLQDASGQGRADLELSDGRIFSLMQTMSADGARYANPSGSFVFWNKGKGAFIEENGTTTWSGCVTK